VFLAFFAPRTQNPDPRLAKRVRLDKEGGKRAANYVLEFKRESIRTYVSI